MIATLWDSITTTMKGAGWVLDASERDSLQERRYTINLPSVTRDENASTVARFRVKREIRIRLQFPERKDSRYQLDIAMQIEQVAAALRAVLTFDTSNLADKGGGKIAELVFSATDSIT